MITGVLGSWSRKAYLSLEGRGFNSIGGRGGLSDSSRRKGSTVLASSWVKNWVSSSKLGWAISCETLVIACSKGSRPGGCSAIAFIARVIGIEYSFLPNWTYNWPLVDPSDNNLNQGCPMMTLNWQFQRRRNPKRLPHHQWWPEQSWLIHDFEEYCHLGL